MLCTSQEPMVLWPLVRPLPQGSSNPYCMVGGTVPLPLPTQTASQWEAAYNESSGCFCGAGRAQQKGCRRVWGVKSLTGPRLVSLHVSSFPVVAWLTVARSRELALNYLTLSHIGLLASGRKSLSGRSSIFFLCFQMGQSVSFLLDLTEATPQHGDIFQVPSSSSLGGNI